jgi:hypothetical protein
MPILSESPGHFIRLPRDTASESDIHVKVVSVNESTKMLTVQYVDAIKDDCIYMDSDIDVLPYGTPDIEWYQHIEDNGSNISAVGHL